MREGEYKCYYPNGNIETKKHYKNGNLHGLYETFLSNGARDTVYHLINGEIIGKYESFYPNGQTKKLAEHVNNWTTTVNIKFYPDGKVQCDMNFKEGKKFGPYKEYYPTDKFISGQIMLTAEFLTEYIKNMMKQEML